MGFLNNYPIPGNLTWINTHKQVIISNPKYVNTLPYYVAIINGIWPNWVFKKATNPDNMEIKDEIVSRGMAWAAADDI